MSNKYEQWVRDGQFVEARYAHGRQGMDVHARGKVVAYCDAPTVVIETDDGTRVHWRADLTDAAERPVCGVSEGMTGIDCGLPKGHVMPDGSLRTVHEGVTTPEQTEQVGYEMSVRWPLAGTLLPVPEPEPEPERSAGCQNHWPVEPEPEVRQKPRRRTFPYEVREWMDEEAHVECFSGRDPEHVVHEGVAIGLTEAPTVRVQKDDGQVVSWVIGLTRRAGGES